MGGENPPLHPIAWGQLILRDHKSAPHLLRRSDEKMMTAIMEITEDKLDRELAAIDRNDREPSDRPQAAISVRGLRKSYGKLEAVRGVDLEIERGEIFG